MQELRMSEAQATNEELAASEAGTEESAPSTAVIEESASSVADSADAAPAESTETAAQESDQGPADGDGDSAQEAPKGAEKRIKQLIGEGKDLRSELDGANAKINALSDALGKSAGNELQEPREEDFEDFDKFRAAEREYYTQLGAQGVTKELHEAVQTERQLADQQAKARRSAAFTANAQEFLKEVDDFVAATAPIMQGGYITNPNLEDGILESSIGPALIYHLSKNPEKIDALNRMSPVQIGRELATLEAALSASDKPNISKAPEPIADVGGGGVARKKPVEEMSDAEYFNRHGTYVPLR